MVQSYTFSTNITQMHFPCNIVCKITANILQLSWAQQQKCEPYYRTYIVTVCHGMDVMPILVVLSRQSEGFIVSETYIHFTQDSSKQGIVWLFLMQLCPCSASVVTTKYFVLVDIFQSLTIVMLDIQAVACNWWNPGPEGLLGKLVAEHSLIE